MVGGAAVGLSLGAGLGDRWNDPSYEPIVLSFRLLGVVFLSMLKALIVPLVVSSIIVAVTGIGELRRVGRAALATAVYFVSTTVVAVLTGMLLVSSIAPGTRASIQGASPATMPAAIAQSPARAIYDVIAGMFPPNAIAAAAESNILGLIVFSLAIGIVLAHLGTRAQRLVELVSIANEALLVLIRFVVWLAPLGILGLIADRVGKAGENEAVWIELQRLAWYAITILIGLALHAGGTLFLILRTLGKRRPLAYLAG